MAALQLGDWVAAVLGLARAGAGAAAGTSSVGGGSGAGCSSSCRSSAAAGAPVSAAAGSGCAGGACVAVAVVWAGSLVPDDGPCDGAGSLRLRKYASASVAAAAAVAAMDVQISDWSAPVQPKTRATAEPAINRTDAPMRIVI